MRKGGRKLETRSGQPDIIACRNAGDGTGETKRPVGGPGLQHRAALHNLRLFLPVRIADRRQAVRRAKGLILFARTRGAPKLGSLILTRQHTPARGANEL